MLTAVTSAPIFSTYKRMAKAGVAAGSPFINTCVGKLKADKEIFGLLLHGFCSQACFRECISREKNNNVMSECKRPHRHVQHTKLCPQNGIVAN